ncbi:VanZ family protein [Flammeovirga kamogawensis]|uniref:VanZ family protein n=1 Tax=Flammeovirga kamogawensis TaxID=373891 RepID=A0ABX8GZI5_9BACT|nr:VanZ family protein [Flammeovirga kamogawensis]MBB6459472.1 hypothetical protein [Flammeovirga kamogawensis]QWG09024.1 VanZ family protein [Flammeovirga kamogawensis]
MTKIDNKNEILKDIAWLVPTILWFFITIKLLLTKNPVEGDSFLLNLPFGDKIGHFGIFGIFTACLMFSLCGVSFMKQNKRLIIITVLTIVFSWGIITEILQANLLDSREGDFWDFIADATGGVLGVICYGILSRFIPIPIYKKPIL